MSDTLPVGAKLREGAYLIEEILAGESGEFRYRAYDVPSRCAVEIREFCPERATRHERNIIAPQGWSTPGWEIAKAKWIQKQAGALAVFEDNGTAYIVTAVAVAPPSIQAPFAIAPREESAAPAPNQTLVQPPLAHENVSVPSWSTPGTPALKHKITLTDLWPDALRGALQGGALCGVLGVFLGAFAALISGADAGSGAITGACGFPVGALGGAILGVLRALPSNENPLATKTTLSLQEQIQSTVSSAGKGALLGLPLGFALMAAMAASEGLSIYSLLSGSVLFTFAGAIAGAVVGFIRIMPRDRQKRG